MTPSEFLNGVAKKFVNTLKKNGAYRQFRSHFSCWARQYNYCYCDPVNTTILFDEFTPCVYDEKGSRTIYEAAILLADLVNTFRWANTPEGLDYWQEKAAKVYKECKGYIDEHYEMLWYGK